MNGNNIEGLKARERMLAMQSKGMQNLHPLDSSARLHRDPEPETVSKTETVRPAKGVSQIAPPGPRRRGRPAKVEQKRQTRPKDAEVFRAAAALLNMTATKDAPKFGVSRQTLAKWMRGETSAPRSAYVFLLDEVIRAVEAGTANINAAAEARLNKAIDERIAAALKIMQKMNRKQGVDA